MCRVCVWGRWETCLQLIAPPSSPSTTVPLILPLQCFSSSRYIWGWTRAVDVLTDHTFPSVFRPNHPVLFLLSRSCTNRESPSARPSWWCPPAASSTYWGPCFWCPGHTSPTLPHSTTATGEQSRSLRTPLPPDSRYALVSLHRLKCQKANTYDVEQFERMTMSGVRSSDGKDNASQDSQNGTSLLWNDAV